MHMSFLFYGSIFPAGNYSSCSNMNFAEVFIYLLQHHETRRIASGWTLNDSLKELTWCWIADCKTFYCQCFIIWNCYKIISQCMWQTISQNPLFHDLSYKNLIRYCENEIMKVFTLAQIRLTKFLLINLLSL